MTIARRLKWYLDSKGVSYECVHHTRTRTSLASVGITAGASTPEELVLELIDKLREFGDIELSVMDGIEEHIQFKLPDALRQAAA